jgi:predicted permease
LRLSNVDPGFESENLHRFTISLPNAKYSTPDEWIGFFDQLEERVASLPGIISVGGILGAPLSPTSVNVTFEQPDRPPPPPGQEPSAAWRVVTPGYFETMGIPLLRGRRFEAGDRTGAQPVTVVTQRFVDRFYPDQDPLGKPIVPQASFSLPEEVPRTIIGVVGDAHYDALSEGPEPAYYVPQGQIGADFLTIMVRGAPGAISMPAIREIVGEMDPDLPLRDVEAMTAVIDQSLGPARFNLLLVAVFAGLAVTLAAVGLYGVVAYSASQRTREIAVRMALGAPSEKVVGMVLRQGLRPALVGILLGLGGAFAGSRLITALLYGTEPTDLLSYLSATALFLIVATLAAVVPAVRASKIAPIVALSRE